ncbi:MAG: TetR/AcrR family transcriptional regulator [Verrucomicrobiota bacterium]
MKNTKKNAAILENANRLFELQGFKGTGVDQIAAESGVTKRTLYKHFGSKEGLIRAVLEAHETSMMERFRQDLAASRMTAKERILLCFDLYRDWFEHTNFTGCIFIKTLNEFANCTPALNQQAQGAKWALRELILEQTKSTRATEPEQLADQIQLLLEGSIILAQSGRGVTIIDAAQEAAAQLLEGA